MKLNLWRVSNESTTQGFFEGVGRSARWSGQPQFFFAECELRPEYLTGLLPVPTSVPAIGLCRKILVSMGRREPEGDAAPCLKVIPNLQLQNTHPHRSWQLLWLRRCCFYRQFAGYKVTVRVCKTDMWEELPFPKRSLLAENQAFTSLLSDLLFFSVVRSFLQSKTQRSKERKLVWFALYPPILMSRSLLLFVSPASVHGHHCKVGS